MYKTFLAITISLLVFVMNGAHAETTPFEGVLEAYGEGSGVTNSVTLSMKGNKARLFPKSNLTSATNGMPLLDYDAFKIYLLSEKEKYYLEMPLEAMEKNLSATPLKLASTGKNSAFLSVNAAEFKGTDKETGVDITAYGSKDIVSKVNVLIAFQRISADGLSISKAGRALLDMGYFPVKVLASKSGKVFFTWELKNIELKTIDPAVLQVPAGYVKFSEYMKKNAKKKGGR